MTPEERAHGILYSTDSREELAERIVALEELALDLFCTVDRWWCDALCPHEEECDAMKHHCYYEGKLKELGIARDG